MTSGTTLKEALDAVWNSRPCLAEGHKLRWATRQGYNSRRASWSRASDLLWFSKGEKYPEAKPPGRKREYYTGK